MLHVTEIVEQWRHTCGRIHWARCRQNNKIQIQSEQHSFEECSRDGEIFLRRKQEEEENRTKN